MSDTIGDNDHGAPPFDETDLGLGRCACGAWAIVRLDAVPLCSFGLARETQARLDGIRQAWDRAFKASRGKTVPDPAGEKAEDPRRFEPRAVVPASEGLPPKGGAR